MEPDGQHLAVGGAFPQAGHEEFEVYKFDHTTETLTLLPETQIPLSIVNSIDWRPPFGSHIAVGQEFNNNAGHNEIEIYQPKYRTKSEWSCDKAHDKES